MNTFALAALPLVAATALAQLPAPNPTPRTAPRAAWTTISGVTGTPAQRRDCPGVASNDRMYVFGGAQGTSGSARFNALYSFDGQAWTERTADGAPGSPPARDRAAIAWDAINDRLVVFGGFDGTNWLGDTWSWDPVTNAWTNLAPPLAPSARGWAAMTYDPTSTGLLLFGGFDGTSYFGDTWLFIGNAWVPLSPATNPPARRMGHLVTRGDFGDAFLCLGDDASTTPQTRMLDTWRWTGADWQQIVPANGSFPHGTTANQAVYDPLRKRVVVTGGQGISVPNTAAGGQYGDLWGGSPSNFTSEFDCVTNEWLLFGSAGFNDTDPVIGRASRYFAAFVPALGAIYKVGGQDPSTGGPRVQTYRYQASPLATATNYGTGCAGSAGVVTLTAGGAPWTGRTFAATVTNLASSSLVFAVAGFGQTSTTLAPLLPAAGAGCVLLTNPASTSFLLNQGGSATFTLPLPAGTSLAGASLNLQVGQVELGPTLQIVGISSSDALTLVVGAL